MKPRKAFNILQRFEAAAAEAAVAAAAATADQLTYMWLVTCLMFA